jgi:hypothetical protein
MQTELMTASVDDNATAHMLDEQGVELTHADCMSMLDKARKYWDGPHKKFEDDYLFAHGHKQWDADIEAQRRRSRRDCKTYNIVQGFIRPLVNAVKQAPPSIALYPVSPDTDKSSAKVIGGVIRHIEYCSNAQRAYTHALEQIAEGGLGAWRVTPTTKKQKKTTYKQMPVQTPYGIQSMPSKMVVIEDKVELSIEQIDNPTNVFFDPSAKLPDFSDANWVIYKNVLSEIDYKKDYPNGTASVEDDTVVVYEYWYFNSKGLVDFVVFDENDVLVHDELELTMLPFVVIAGDKINVDGEVSFKSLTTEIRAPQQEINWLKSEAISTVSQAPKVSFIVDDEAINKVDEDAWANAATDPDVFLRKKRGSEVIPVAPPGPPSGYMELSNSNIEMARQITGIYPDPSTQAALSNASGKAIAYQQAGSQIQTYHFVDALNYGIKRTGEILLDMISVYYNDDDIRISMGVDNNYQHVSIGPTNVPGVNNVDLTFNQYGVIISNGPTYSTQKEQFSEQLMKFAQGNPQMMPLIADIVVRYSSIPGSEELADRFRVMLPEPVQQVIASQAQYGGDPEQIAQMQMIQIQQMGQQMQQAQQQIQMLSAELQKAHDANQVKVLDIQTKKEINEDNNKAKFAMQEAQHAQEDQLAALNATMQLILARLDGHQKGEIENIKSMNRTSESIERGLKG